MHDGSRTTFSPELIGQLDGIQEIHIETRSAEGAIHQTIVWVVVDAGEVFLRSFRGPTARWYREILAGPDAAIVVNGERHPVRVEEAIEPGDIARCSRVLESKYAGEPATPAMLRAEVLDTTLRLLPA